MNFVIRFDNLTKLYENVLHFCQWQMAAYIRRLVSDKICIKIQEILTVSQTKSPHYN